MKTFFQSLVLKDVKTPRWLAWLLVVAMLGLIPLYYFGAVEAGEKLNTDLVKNDQRVHLRYGLRLMQRDYDYFIPRHRMPGYGMMLSRLVDEEMAALDDVEALEKLFAKARIFNIVLSLFLLVGIFIFCRFMVPLLESALTTLGIGLLMFVLKSPYVQPELLVYTFSLFGVILLLKLLKTPMWWLALTVGITLATWYYIKSNAHLVPVIFFVMLFLKSLWQWKQKEITKKIVGINLAKGALVGVVFCAILSPYFLENIRIFKSPFYAVQSKYHMWCDSRQQMMDINKDYEVGRSLVEDPSLPSMEKWFSENSAADAWNRLCRGIDHQLTGVRKNYNEFWVFGRFYFYIAILLSLIAWRGTLAFIKRNPFEILFVLAYLISHQMIFGWFASITKSPTEPDNFGLGPRVTLTLSLTPFFLLIYYVYYRAKDMSFAFLSHDWSVRKLVNIVAVFYLVSEGWIAMTQRLPTMYAGG